MRLCSLSAWWMRDCPPQVRSRTIAMSSADTRAATGRRSAPLPPTTRDVWWRARHATRPSGAQSKGSDRNGAESQTKDRQWT
eukprot:6193055-Pleurochrysis_carterae.AAC.5